MKLQTISVSALMLICATASAAPSVSHNTISWPDDGWYQVQTVNDDGIFEVCQGGESCDVAPGEYIVINLTTGERFADILVPGSSNVGSIVVTGNLISWPDDGWYQVQDKLNFTELCGGTRSCTVDSGTYVVINHTTSQRWDDIVVGDAQILDGVRNLRFERYSSSAIELFWSHPESGENANGYSIYQDGVLLTNVIGNSLYIEGITDSNSYEFEVSPSGQTDGALINVPAVGTSVDTLNIANAQIILTNVASAINEDAIEAFYQTANDDQLLRNKTFFISNTSDDIQRIGEETLETPYQVESTFGQGNFVDANRSVSYSCAGGGGLVGYFGTTGIDDDWVFDNCVLGSNTYSGTAGARVIVRGAINQAPVFDLNITTAEGQARSLSGGYSAGNLSFVVINEELNWDSATYRGPVDGGQLEIDDYTVSRIRRDNSRAANFLGRRLVLPNGTIVQTSEYSVSNKLVGSFSVRAPWSQNESLIVTVDLSFSDDVIIATDVVTGEIVEYSGSDPTEAFNWQSGSINITAEDGSQLVVTPIEGQLDDFSITTSNGETVRPVSVEVKP